LFNAAEAEVVWMTWMFIRLCVRPNFDYTSSDIKLFDELASAKWKIFIGRFPDGGHIMLIHPKLVFISNGGAK
jgi:hypothetical protein